MHPLNPRWCVVAPDQRGELLADGRSGEAALVEPPGHRLPSKSRDEDVGHVFGVSMVHHHQQPLASQRAYHVVQLQQRAVIRLVCVVEHDNNSRNRSSLEPLPLRSRLGASNTSGASRTRSEVSPSLSAIVTTSTLADTPRSTCRHGQYGGAPLDSVAGPHAAGTPLVAASSVSSSAIRVLPIPGSPRRSTTRGCAARADSRCSTERGQLPFATNQLGTELSCPAGISNSGASARGRLSTRFHTAAGTSLTTTMGRTPTGNIRLRDWTAVHWPRAGVGPVALDSADVARRPSADQNRAVVSCHLTYEVRAPSP